MRDQLHFSSVAHEKPKIYSLSEQKWQLAVKKGEALFVLARARAKKPQGWELSMACKGQAKLGKKSKRQLATKMQRCSGEPTHSQPGRHQILLSY